MNKQNILITIGIIISLGLIFWAWNIARQRSTEESIVSSPNANTPTEPKQIAQPVPPKFEERFSITYKPNSTNDTVGSITLKDANGQYVFLSTERPGDSIMMTLGGFSGSGGSVSTVIGSGDGSEIRFVGKHDTYNGTLTGEKDSRLCFRKSQGDWVYVCGLGQYEEDGKIKRLGFDRTVNSCLSLLSGSDEILREGAARDLGRLTGTKDMTRVVPKLKSLLTDPSLFVRRGAAEGLGLIGSPDCFRALKDALPNETDKNTKEYIEEALTICAAYVLMDEPAAAGIPMEEAVEIYSQKEETKTTEGTKEEKTKAILGGWAQEMVKLRAKPHMQEVLKSLVIKKSSTTVKVANAAEKLIGILEKDESK